MIDEIFSRLLDYAAIYDIEVGFEDRLSPNTPCTADSKTRRILINLNWHIPRQLPFQLAHEITHILNGDSNLLYFTPSKTGIEGDANSGAICLLVPMYFENVDPSLARVDEFMSFFAISPNMRDICSGAIKGFYNAK
ncbi:ImmA/IrrE family metallo-endopeptidase [Lacticaseibacillus baoqingensis]|uniref:ImmA/IrrE family metallo-endopeptidase n=1 Tax=Lacticaseibacillus baoqingensis TaxID=2486013 RepID=A0ABW4EA84_9LACO|nr:ImmA/IrrE family metallo-endopeptidase [Lacticaseibacillus baoqingensis]